jgi:hypothetical protein
MPCPATVSSVSPDPDAAEESREAEIDERLEETFPSSDPPSTWAGEDPAD